MVGKWKTKKEHRSGFVGIVGAPNAGKSTLLNRILGEKVAITSSKPQTTRHRILGVETLDDAQIIFMDTPGIHQARDLLNKELVAAAFKALDDADLILFMVEPKGSENENKMIMDHLKDAQTPVILAINKVDKVAKQEILPIIDRFQGLMEFAAIVPISAKDGANVPELLQEIVNHLPEGPQYYPPDTLTDQPERFIAAEMVREQVFKLTGKEIPYATAVTVNEYKFDGRITRIQADIHVERDSQKRIVIGKGGSKLKEIGTAARQDLERMADGKVFLQLFVKVRKNWSKDPRALKDFGYVE